MLFTSYSKIYKLMTSQPPRMLTRRDWLREESGEEKHFSETWLRRVCLTTVGNWKVDQLVWMSMTLQ